MMSTKTFTTRAAIAAGTIALAFVGIAGTAGSASAAGMHNGSGKAPLSSLVTAGTITQAQATSIKDAMIAARTANRAAHDRVEATTISGLVSRGTLTQAQADAITSADGRQGMRSLVTSGLITRELARQVHTDVKAAMDAVATKPEAVLASLVSAGTITQAQADAIEAARPARAQGPRGA
jgi:hypothetical protein